MESSWIIGANPGCDLVVSHPLVTARHCRLTLDSRGYLLEDLGSRSGTFVNGQRIGQAVRISTDDVVTLGMTVRMPWPGSASTTLMARSELRVGRAADNDFVVNQAVVSGYHARVIRGNQPGQGIIEDLNSANGLAIGSPGRKVSRSEFGPGDTIYLGTCPVAGSELLARLDPSAPIPSRFTVRVSPESRSPIDGKTDLIRLSILVSEGPVLAMGLGAFCWIGSQFNPNSSVLLASSLFWVGLAAVWLGASGALIGQVIDLDRSPRPGRLGIVLAVGLFQVGIVWTMVSIVAELSGGWLASVGLMTLAWWIGLALGCAILATGIRTELAWSALGMLMLGLWVFGGGPQSIPRRLPVVSTICEASPARWVFEGLLLTEVDSRANRAVARDLAEDYFPIATDRMGIRADVMALVAILVGLSMASISIIGVSRLNQGSS